MKKAIIYSCWCLILIICYACSAKLVLPTHNPKLLMKLQTDSALTLPTFGNKEIIIQMEGDLTVCPTGTYLQNYDNSINPVMQTYITEKPGYVLLEKIAEVLERQNMHVYRLYTLDKPLPANLKNLKILRLRFDDFEMHVYRIKNEGEYFLGRADVSFEILQQEGAKVSKQIRVRAKTSINKDIFTELAGQFVTRISNEL